LRCELRLNAEGDSGLFFRASDVLDANGAPSQFYEAEINTGSGSSKTGGLWRSGSGVPLAHVDQSLVPSDTWFTLEVIARGTAIVVKVNGQVTADVRDEGLAKGHLAWQIFDPATRIEIRKIEVRELTAH